MYQNILDTKGRGNFKKAMTNIYGFKTDDKILTGVNSILSSQEFELFNIFHAGRHNLSYQHGDIKRMYNVYDLEP